MKISGTEPRPKRRFVRPSKRIIVFFIVFVVIIVAGSIGYWQHTEFEKRDLLKTASNHFVIYAQPDVSKGQEKSTAIELERAYRHLSDLVPAFTVGSRIQVHIYRSIAEMKSSTGIPGNTAGLTLCSPNGPIMYLPTERDSSNSKTATPAHEMVHATICDLIGYNHAEVIPKWFHEGLAEYESRRGWGDRMIERISIRVFVLWNHDDIMPYSELNSYDPLLLDDHDKIFYSSSFEFMRYIISKSDRHAPWEIVEAVGEGQSFESAFQKIIGDTPRGMYQKWVNNFYGVLQ